MTDSVTAEALIANSRQAFASDRLGAQAMLVELETDLLAEVFVRAAEYGRTLNRAQPRLTGWR